ncbi:hypothetical protein HK096_002467, partial [Nowakowskiella sp. JEL0078]
MKAALCNFKIPLKSENISLVKKVCNMKKAILCTTFICLLASAFAAQTTTVATVRATATGTTTSSQLTFTKWCAAGNAMCVAAIPIPASNPTSVQFTMWSVSNLWVGIGIGSSMADADIYIGWNAQTTKAMIVSDRTSSGHSLPASDSTQQIKVTTVPAVLNNTIPSNAKTIVSFTRALTVTSPDKSISKGSMSYIYAYAATRPASDISTSSFGQHDSYGSMTFDFLTLSAANNQSSLISSSSGGPIFVVSNSIIIHGIIMTIAWGLCPVAGIFIARYLKDALGIWWYYSHMALMLGGATVISWAGIIFIILTSSPPHFDLSSPHKPIGLAIGIDSVLQTALGFVCNHLWSPERRSIPWWDKVHWWNGRILAVLGLVNIYLGLNLYGAGLAFTVSFFVFIGVSLAILIAGQFFFGQVHHVKEDVEFTGGQISAQTVSFSKWCSSGSGICIAAIPVPAVNPTSVQFTMWSATNSWISFGIGSSMSDADVYVGWNALSNNAMIVSDRTATTHLMPVHDTNQQIKIASIPAVLSSTIPANPKTAVSFNRTLTVASPDKAITAGKMNYIYAVSTRHPTSDVASSTFLEHDTYGTFSFDFLTLPPANQTNQTTSDSGSSGGPIFTVANKNLIHGVLMTISWVLCPIIGIFVARYLKDVLGKWWYYTHVIVMFGGSLLLSTTGILFIVLTSSPPHFSLDSAHKPIGLAIGIDAIIQTVLGFICNHLWSPERRTVPWWDKVHWWNGRLLTVLALVNVYLGLSLANADLAFVITFFVIVGISIAAIVAGQLVYGQVHHI